MRWRLPRLSPRFRLSTMGGLIVLCALAMWAGLFFLSPTKRFARQIRADQPTYLRSEAVLGLGYVPSWEADEAIGVLIGALKDPSPRVREKALAALGAHGVRAERAVPEILKSLDDPDRNVRYTAYAVLGLVVSPKLLGPDREKVLDGLTRSIQDEADPQNRLAAAISLLRLGESRAAVPTIVLALGDKTQPNLQAQARFDLAPRGSRGLLTERVKAELIRGATRLLNAQDSAQRRSALEVLIEIAPASTVRGALRAALQDSDTETRRWASEKLKSLSADLGSGDRTEEAGSDDAAPN